MNTDGTGLRLVATAYGSPAWSPDGRSIAATYAGDPATGSDDGIWLLALDATGNVTAEHRLTTGLDSDPNWSPDGTAIVFGRRVSGTVDVYWIDAGGTTAPINLTNSAAQDRDPAWSADGTKIVFVSTRHPEGNADIYAMAPDGSNVIRLTATGAPASSLAPAWKPRAGRRP